MKNYKRCIWLLAATLAINLSGCSLTDSDKGENGTDANQVAEDLTNQEETGQAGSFRPVDCGMQSQNVYEFPFTGITAELSADMLAKMDSRDVFVRTDEDYADANTISYAVIRFSAPNEEQKSEERMSVDIVAWEAALDKIGAIGVYQKNMVSQLDALTSCDTHKKIGESTDGLYEYYLSTNSKGNEELVKELEKSDVFIGEMHELDTSLGYSAFSVDRLDGVETVGEFKTKDIFGNSYTQDVFAEYDLTLVNVFTTWCSPCVEEIPELEEVREAYEKKGKKVGVVAVVYDAKTSKGTDKSVVEQAKVLYERSKAQFPFLIPDDGNMNGRLTGIESVPESFFVDKNGTIVSEPYIGANSKKEWTKIIDKELAKLEGTN